MDDERKLEVALQFRNLADANSDCGKLSDAFFYYVNCLKAYPNWQTELKEKFLGVLIMRDELSAGCLGQALVLEHNYRELCNVYKSAFEIYPDNAELYNNFGAHSLRLGYVKQAIVYFKKALLKNANFFAAYRNLLSAHCAAVERWHYRMLNDSLRNEAYRSAIANKVSQGFDSVLDIGTGTGLLCLYARQAGAKKIYACEYNPTMTSIALQVFSKNKLIGKVKLIDKHSNDLKIPNDLHERVSLVVTETLDACMLGERILHTLDYAWKYLLKPPASSNPDGLLGEATATGCVIPHSGSLQFRLLQSPVLARHYVFPLLDTRAEDCAAALANITLADAGEDAGGDGGVRDLNVAGLVLRAALDDEPYDAVRLPSLPDCVVLSDSHNLLRVNFNDPACIRHLLSCDDSTTFEVVCTRDGYLHALAAWFDVQLDENTCLTSAPDRVDAEQCCWDQAVFPCAKAFRVYAGSRVSVLSNWLEGKVSLQAMQIAHPDGRTVVATETPLQSVNPRSVQMLNDGELVSRLEEAAVQYVKACGSAKNRLKIMDSFACPVFGMTVLSNLHLANLTYDDAHMVCIARSLADQSMVETLARTNNIPSSCLTVLRGDELDELLVNSSNRESFDAILVDFVDPIGELNEETISAINLFKSLLKQDGVLLPKKVQIVGQLIQSHYVEQSLRVVDRDIFKYGIGDCLNQFQVHQLLDVDVASLKYDTYSNPFVCCSFPPYNLDSEFRESHAVFATRSGDINSILCWFSFSFFDESSFYSTLHHFAYAHQTVFLSSSSNAVQLTNDHDTSPSSIPIPVQLNDLAVVDVVYHRGAIIMNLNRRLFSR